MAHTPMRYRTLGRTGLRVSLAGLGTGGVVASGSRRMAAGKTRSDWYAAPSISAST